MFDDEIFKRRARAAIFAKVEEEAKHADIEDLAELAHIVYLLDENLSPTEETEE